MWRDEPQKADGADETYGRRHKKRGRGKGGETQFFDRYAETFGALFPYGKCSQLPHGGHRDDEGRSQGNCRCGGGKFSGALQVAECPAVDELSGFGAREIKQQFLQRRCPPK